jgi:hypothetical protein
VWPSSGTWPRGLPGRERAGGGEDIVAQAPIDPVIPQVKEADRLAGATDLGRHLIAPPIEKRGKIQCRQAIKTRAGLRDRGHLSSDAEGYIAKVWCRKDQATAVRRRRARRRFPGDVGVGGKGARARGAQEGNAPARSPRPRGRPAIKRVVMGARAC